MLRDPGVRRARRHRDSPPAMADDDAGDHRNLWGTVENFGRRRCCDYCAGWRGGGVDQPLGDLLRGHRTQQAMVARDRGRPGLRTVGLADDRAARAATGDCQGCSNSDYASVRGGPHARLDAPVLAAVPAYAGTMSILLLPLSGAFLIIRLATLVLIAAAVVSALTHRPEAFVAAGKQTKQFWTILLVVGILLSFVGIFSLIGIVAALVYFLDVRPALQTAGGGGGGSRGGRGSSSDGPYGPFRG
jgi:hypothetical protein